MTAAIQTSEHLVTVPGGNVFVKRWTPETLSSESPIILLHDSLGSVAQWRDFPERLSQKLSRSVIAYDRLGFGQSSSRTELPSVDFISEEANLYFPALKEALSIERYILLGHSVGGGMALNIAATDTDCEALVSIAAQAFVKEVTLRGIAQAKTVFDKPEQMAKLEKWHGSKAP
ncbi:MULTISPECIES: alpha/beta fold hydrolase [Alteromonas]|jgi:pimeloyl-ACP methyl ester carboxylesterase|uniref:alpha/beta fold hydrolase n=1 Tax=Alteromonas TaxID=226 RepID=UPI001EF1872E|nr:MULTISPECIES: alpha/beta fold hydrolase [Alteromonas]MCG7639779.1 alpha/beta hydrolase [Alteromonas sp. CNT1-28]MCG7813956.1 alpha/beta hydrolase [Alteromonas sp. MCA-1]MCZ4242343.1 alpha/beta fold hydrolase [Alteromonas macleodii]